MEKKYVCEGVGGMKRESRRRSEDEHKTTGEEVFM